MAIKAHTYMGHTIWVGGYDLLPAPKGRPDSQGKVRKSQPKLIARKRNKVRSQQANNHTRC